MSARGSEAARCSMAAHARRRSPVAALPTPPVRDCLETQVDLIELIGEPNYLQSAVGGLDENKSQASGGD